MNIEQLKLILDAFGNATGGAYVISILWVCKGYFTFAIGAGVVVYLARLLAKVIKNLSLASKLGVIAKLDPSIDAHQEKMIAIFRDGLEK